MRSISEVTVCLLSLMLSLSLGTSLGAQELPRQVVLIDSFPVYDLPLSISNASLTKTENGYLLKLSAANSSNERILSLRYLLLILNSADKNGRLVDYSESVRLGPYSMKEVSLRTPSRLKIRDGDRAFLVLAEVVGGESIWEALKAKDALEAYANGAGVNMPKVLHMPNEVDSPLGKAAFK